MKKFLLLLLLIPLLALGDEVTVKQTVSGDVSRESEWQVTMTCDSNAADSSYGTFTTESFDIGGALGVGGYAHYWLTSDCTRCDTIILHCITAHYRDVSTPCTLSVDTLAAVGFVEYWLGKTDAWTGTDSLFPGGELWWDGEIWDSASDSANHGTEVDYYWKFKLDGAGCE